MQKFLPVIVLMVLCWPRAGFADVINIVASGAGANVESISQVVLSVTDGSGTNVVIQNAPVTGTTQGAMSAFLQSLTTTAGVFDTFDPITPTIIHVPDNGSNNGTGFPTPPLNAPGIQVLTPTQAFGAADADFLTQLANVHSNGDLVNYLRVDGGNFTPEWDVVYSQPFAPNQYIIFEERDGNTTFTVDPLDVNGNPIPDSDTLAFDGNSYEWSIGLSNTLDPFGDQSQVLGVLDFDMFFTSDPSAAAPIGGFRINDTGNADFKFFVGTLAVPEPGHFSMLALLGLSTLRRRRVVRKP